MSDGIASNIGKSVESLKSLTANLPELPVIPEIPSGIAGEALTKAQEAQTVAKLAYERAMAEIRSMVPVAQHAATSAMGAVEQQITSLKGKIADMEKQITPLTSLSPLGGLSLESMATFATNVENAFNALLTCTAGPTIIAMKTASGQIASLASGVSELSAAVSALESKLPHGMGLPVPTMPSLPTIPTIPAMPSV